MAYPTYQYPGYQPAPYYPGPVPDQFAQLRQNLQMQNMPQPQPQISAYSEASTPAGETLGLYGESDFLRAVAGIPAPDAWAVMDELMDTLQVVNPRTYDSVMRKLGRI